VILKFVARQGEGETRRQGADSQLILLVSLSPCLPVSSIGFRQLRRPAGNAIRSAFALRPFFVGLHNFMHEPMPYDVFLVERDVRKPLDVP
jgi:hypothetical protein